MQDPATRNALLEFDVEFNRALGPVGRESRRCRAHGIGPHPSPKPAAKTLTHDYSAIWRLISAGSIALRSQAYLTAPRSMTAKLSPSSQAKSRYCSTSTIAILPRLRR